MHVPDAKLAEVWDRGWTVVECFVGRDELKAAQEALWTIYPKPKEYFADPEKHPSFSRSQFSGLRFFPYAPWALNALPVNPDLVDAAERFCGSDDIEIYKIEV